MEGAMTGKRRRKRKENKRRKDNVKIRNRRK